MKKILLSLQLTGSGIHSCVRQFIFGGRSMSDEVDREASLALLSSCNAAVKDTGVSWLLRWHWMISDTDGALTERIFSGLPQSVDVTLGVWVPHCAGVLQYGTDATQLSPWAGWRWSWCCIVRSLRCCWPYHRLLLLMCWVQLRYRVMVTSRYLAEKTVTKIPSWSRYCNSDVSCCGWREESGISPGGRSRPIFVLSFPNVGGRVAFGVGRGLWWRGSRQPYHPQTSVSLRLVAPVDNWCWSGTVLGPTLSPVVLPSARWRSQR